MKFWSSLRWLNKHFNEAIKSLSAFLMAFLVELFIFQVSPVKTNTIGVEGAV